MGTRRHTMFHIQKIRPLVVLRVFIGLYILHRNSAKMSFKVHLFENVRQVHLVHRDVHQFPGVQVQGVSQIFREVWHLEHLATRTYLANLVLRLIGKVTCLLWKVCQIIPRPRWSSISGVTLSSMQRSQRACLHGSITELQKQMAATSSTLGQSEETLSRVRGATSVSGIIR